jgi:hypothetical protein
MIFALQVLWKTILKQNLINTESTKKVRNEVELLILLYGNTLDYNTIYEIFEISEKTFKRDIQVLKLAFDTLFQEEAKLIKTTNKLAYKLIIPHKPILLI